jgi:hypothetical protein
MVYTGLENIELIIGKRTAIAKVHPVIFDLGVPVVPQSITVRTGLGQLGVAPHIAEAVLNHIPPKLIRTYDRNKYEAEKRAALEQWATHLKTIIAQTTGANVTALKPRR